MDGFLNLLYGAGWPGMLVLFLGGLSLVLGVIAIIMLLTEKAPRGTKVVGLWALGFSLATFAMSGIGYWLGMRMVKAAVMGAAPEVRAMLMAYGTEEAFGCVWLAIYTASLPALLGLIAYLGGRSRANPPGDGFQPPTVG